MLIKNDNKEYEFILSNYNGEKNNVLGMDILKEKIIVFDCEQMKLGLYGQNMFNVEKEQKDDEAPIIPKDDDEKRKREGKRKRKGKGKRKRKGKGKRKRERKGERKRKGKRKGEGKRERKGERKRKTATTTTTKFK